jgi:hypothetical protein
VVAASLIALSKPLCVTENVAFVFAAAALFARLNSVYFLEASSIFLFSAPHFYAELLDEVVLPTMTHRGLHKAPPVN